MHEQPKPPTAVAAIRARGPRRDFTRVGSENLNARRGRLS